MKPETIVNILLEMDDEQLPKEPDDTQYGAALRELDAIAAKAREADEKYGQIHTSLSHYLPKTSPEQSAKIIQRMSRLDQLYAERRHKLAQMRYALHYRWALRKAGVKPEDVAERFTNRQSKFGHLIKVMLIGVKLKDGRQVKLEPFEIPRELLKP